MWEASPWIDIMNKYWLCPDGPPSLSCPSGEVALRAARSDCPIILLLTGLAFHGHHRAWGTALVWGLSGHLVPVLLKWLETHQSFLANDSTAFICKVCCHWLQGLRQHHIPSSMHSLPLNYSYPINHSCQIWSLWSYLWQSSVNKTIFAWYKSWIASVGLHYIPMV